MTAPVLPEIVFESFAKCDIRVGMIYSAERVPKSDKLLKLSVHFGELGFRQIVAGIGKDFDPASLNGMQVVAVVNLVPKPIFSIESHGMILCAKSEDGKVHLVQCPGAPMGARLS